MNNKIKITPVVSVLVTAGVICAIVAALRKARGLEKKIRKKTIRAIHNIEVATG